MTYRGNQHDLHGMLISDTSIKQPVFVTMLMLLALVIGLLAYLSRPVNLLPDIDLPIISIVIAYPGAGPESVVEQVARPVEEQISTLSGVTRLTSTASRNQVSMIVEFVDGTDADVALQDVRQQVEAIRDNLPTTIREPIYQRIDPNQAPILTIAVTNQGNQDIQTTQALLDDEIVPLIQRVNGVGAVDLNGGVDQQINVLLDLGRLQTLHILPSQVSEAIGAAGVDVGLGDTQVGDLLYDLHTPSVFQSPQDIATVGIGQTGYTIADVATIDNSYAEVSTLVRLNGTEAITIDIRNQTDTNVTAVAEAALAEAETALANYPDLNYEVVRNEAAFVRANVNSAIEEIVVAVVMAILVVWFFFRNIRNTLITVIGLPIILISTFTGMAIFGITINIVSLLALSVAVGLVIDDAIVVRENIFRHLERGEQPMIAASQATAQVATSILAMTLTIIVVFAPTAFTSGTTGIVFYSFGIVVACGMAFSFLEAFTLGPMLSSRFLKQQEPKPITIKPGEEHFPHEAHEQFGRAEQFYGRVLSWTLDHRAITVILGVVVIVASLLAAQTLQFSFFPTPEEHQFAIALEMPAGTPLEATNTVARDIEQIILNDPSVDSVVTTVGEISTIARTIGSPQEAEFLVNIEQESTTPVVQQRLREDLAGFPGINFSLPSYQSESTTNVAQRPLQIQVRSTGDIDEIAPVVDQMLEAMQGVEGLADIDTTYDPGSPELEYRILQSRANDYGLSNQDVAITLRTLIDGNEATVYREEGQDYPVVVQLREEDRQSAEALASIQLPVGPNTVPLGSITEVVEDSSPTVIRRTDRQSEIIIGANNVGRNLNEVRSDMADRIATVAIPSYVTVSFGGATEDQAEGFRTLLSAASLSVLFVYMVLASQFGSFFQPLVIMLAMPLSFLGAFVALWLTGQDLNIVAMIGMLMLLGVVVKNSILLVEFTNQLRRAGMPIRAALERAGAVRLRAVLMTAITLILGSMPAAVGLGEGAELRRGLATVVIGGVITSTFLTLLLVPTAYNLMEGFLAWLSHRVHGSSESSQRTETPALAHAGTTGNDGSGATLSTEHTNGEDDLVETAKRDTDPGAAALIAHNAKDTPKDDTSQQQSE